MVSHSSVESEYNAMDHTTCELLCVFSILEDFGITSTPIPLFYNIKYDTFGNNSPVFMSE